MGVLVHVLVGGKQSSRGRVWGEEDSQDEQKDTGPEHSNILDIPRPLWRCRGCVPWQPPTVTPAPTPPYPHSYTCPLTLPSPPPPHTHTPAVSVAAAERVRANQRHHLLVVEAL